jgi:hypothetical protein
MEDNKEPMRNFMKHVEENPCPWPGTSGRDKEEGGWSGRSFSSQTASLRVDGAARCRAGARGKKS